jgi:hypothetical protein
MNLETFKKSRNMVGAGLRCLLFLDLSEARRFVATAPELGTTPTRVCVCVNRGGGCARGATPQKKTSP